MLVFFFILVFYVNGTQFRFGDSSHLNDNLLYEGNTGAETKGTIATAATPLNINWWKWKVTTSNVAHQFVNDMITGTRAVIRRKFEEKRDDFIQKLPISDSLQLKMKSATNEYVAPIMDRMFIKTMEFGYGMAQKELADECHIDAKHIPTFTYSKPTKVIFHHPVGLIANPWFVTSQSITHRPLYGPHALTFADQVTWRYLSSPVPQIRPKASRVETCKFKVGMRQAKNEFNTILNEEQQKLRKTIEESTPTLHKLFPVRMKKMDDSAVNTFTKYAHLCFNLLEEGMETKLKMDQKEAIEFAHAQYRNKYAQSRLLRYDY